MTFLKVAKLWCAIVFGTTAAFVLASLVMFAIKNPGPACLGLFIVITLSAFAYVLTE